MRGYGGSDKPPEVADYRLEQITADVAGVVEALSPDGTAVLVGHDWGAPIVWNTALTRPDRVRAVARLVIGWRNPRPRRSGQDAFRTTSKEAG